MATDINIGKKYGFWLKVYGGMLSSLTNLKWGSSKMSYQSQNTGLFGDVAEFGQTR